jgi:ribokinase
MVHVFGSLNIDRVYSVDRIFRAGETVAARRLDFYAGGKGANQAMACAAAGAPVRLIGKVGRDGEWMLERLRAAGVDTAGVRVADAPSGHAVILLDAAGQNAIAVYGGTNQAVEAAEIDEALERVAAGDFVLTQNESSNVARVISGANAKGAIVCLNPSPMDAAILKLPLDRVGLFVVNEAEGAALVGETDPDAILDAFARRFPDAAVALTLGAAGAALAHGGVRSKVDGLKVDVVDTTGAGDAFVGFLLAARVLGRTWAEALDAANRAAAYAVTQQGADKKLPPLDAPAYRSRPGRGAS